MPGYLRVIAFVVVGLLLVLVVAAVAVYAISESKLNRTLRVPPESVAVPTDTTSIQRGQHLAASVATCIDCHGPTLGGKIFVDDPALAPDYGQYLADSAGCPSCHGPGLSGGKIPQAPPDTVPAANITSAGLGAWSEADFLKALRTGMRPDGRVLNTFMPWPYYAQM